METLSVYKTEPNFAFHHWAREGLENKWDWLILPTTRNRDSDLLSESNFTVALRELGGEGDKVEVHRMGHWACGYYEIIIVHPDLTSTAEEIESALAVYPVLDNMHFSELEYEAAYEDWGRSYGGQYYFAEYLAEEYELDPNTKEFLQDSDVAEDMYELSRECECTYYSDNEGIKWDYRDCGLDRDKLAKAIMKMRSRLRKAS